MRKFRILSAILISGMCLGLLSGCDGAKTNPVHSDVSVTSASDNSYVDGSTVRSFLGEGVQDVTVNSHNVEEAADPYVIRDTVNVTYQAGDFYGLIPQTVTKEMVFCQDKDTLQWTLTDETTLACDVDNEALKGTTWKCEELTEEELKCLFGDKIPAGETGTVYIRIMKKIGLFAVKPDDANTTPAERYFQSVGTNANVIWAGENGSVEIKCAIPDGTVTDSGILNLNLESDNGTVSVSFGSAAVPVSEQEYDQAAGKEIDESKVYMDSLPVFEVTTTSIENGEWRQETGLMIDNLSPELTWEPVEGATKYAVIMLDVSTNNWLSWFVIVDETHLDEGAYTEQDVYVGPYPPGTHTYEVYVIALRTDPKPVSFPIDSSGGDISAKMNFLNVASDGSNGNVLAYGMIRADYTADELYYGYR